MRFSGWLGGRGVFCLAQMTGALNDLLKATSRSFYLTLRVLPAAVHPSLFLLVE
jgi:hypothetical protein